MPRVVRSFYLHAWRLFAAASFLFVSGCAQFEEWLNPTPVHGSLPIAVSGKALASIVIPLNAPAPVRFAAEELKRHLEKMTGGSFPIVAGVKPDAMAIMLGETLAEQDGFSLEGVPVDGYRIVKDGAYLYIAGHDDATFKSQILFLALDGPLPASATLAERERAYGSVAWDFERGTLHGVYAFLETFGVRWIFPGPHGTIIPSHGTLEIPDGQDFIGQPRSYLRVAGDIAVPGVGGYRPDYPEMFSKLGWDGRAQRLWMVRQRASSSWMAFGERVNSQQWAARFAGSHPDYFALQADGTRSQKPGETHLNYSSEGVLQETLLDLGAFTGGRSPTTRGIEPSPVDVLNAGWPPQSSYTNSFSLSPAPMLLPDLSPGSLADSGSDEPYAVRNSAYVWKFMDRLAQQALTRFPEQYLTCVARETYLEPPPKMKHLPKNLVIGVGNPDQAGGLSGLANGRAFKNYIGILDDWNDLNGLPLLLDASWAYRAHHPLYRGVPMLLPHLAGKLMKESADYAFWIHLTYDLDNPMFSHIDRYVMYRLMWNPTQEVDDILADYGKSFYGPGEKSMMSIFHDIEAHCMEIAADDQDLEAIWEKHFTSETLQRYRNWLIEAKVQTAGTQYQHSVEAMEAYWLGAMETGRNMYLTHVKSARAVGQDTIRISSVERSITVDGKLQDSHWQVDQPAIFYDIATGKRLEGSTYAKFGVDKQALYCGLVSDRGGSHRIEILVGVADSRRQFYEIQVGEGDKVRDAAYLAPTLPPDQNWDSGAWAASRSEGAGWETEIALPRRSMPVLDRFAKQGVPVTVVITWLDAVGNVVQQATTSPILQGTLYQPEAFSRLVLKAD